MIPVSYDFYIEKDTFVIIPSIENPSYIVIDRFSEQISLQKGKIQLLSEPYKICGVWGMIKLLSGNFLIIIKEISLVGILSDHQIYKIVESQIIPLARSNRHLSDSQLLIEKEYLSMLETVLQTEGFYFSPTADLTHSFQRLQDVSQDFYNMSLIERADERFVWNRFMLSSFIEILELHEFCVPIMHGFAGVINNQISRDSSPFQLWLISRRSVHRAGTRYYSRGVDNLGNVSNCVETEQILIIDTEIISFLQTRGSIPLIWSQKPNMYYKPSPKLLASDHEQISMLKEHFNSQIFLHKYGRQTVINLLNQSGSEKPLGSLFSRIIHEANIPDLKYIAYDFHNMCKNLKWDKLHLLMDSLTPDMDSMRYLHISSKNKNELNRQKGVFRTNCIDCLDRTNVVQSMIAWCVLEHIFMDLKILQTTSTYKQSSTGGILSQTCPELNFQYKNLWADNGDHLATQYTGTGALKSDFTRTGKRSFIGLLSDGYKSSIRYVLNNFRDGFRQDAMDLFLGNYVTDSLEGSSNSHPSPIQTPRTMKYKIVPWAVLISLSLLILKVLFPSDDLSNQAFYIFVLIAIIIFCVTLVFSNGYEFVDSPRLKKDD